MKTILPMVDHYAVVEDGWVTAIIERSPMDSSKWQWVPFFGESGESPVTLGHAMSLAMVYSAHTADTAVSLTGSNGANSGLLA